MPWALKKQAKLRASNFSLYSEAPHPACSCPPWALKAWLQLDTWIWGWQLFHQLLSWKQRAGLCVLLWELCRGDVGQGTHQGGWDNSHPWPGKLFSIFIAAFPAKWNDFLGEAQPGARFPPELQTGQLPQADSDCVTFQQNPPLPYTHGLGGCRKNSPLPSLPIFPCQALSTCIALPQR